MGRHTLSTVYEYFNYDKQNQESICNDCNGKIKGKHGTNLKRHLSSHQDFYEEMLVKDKVKKKSSAKTTTSVIKAHEKLFHFSTPEVKVNINMNTLISICVDLVTINGRPYSLLNDTGFKNIINPILDGMNKKVAINSNTIKVRQPAKQFFMAHTKVNPFQVDINNVKNDLQIEIIELQNYKVLKNSFWEATSLTQFYSCLPTSIFPGIRRFAQKLKAAFASTYICEQTFSIVKYRKNKHSSLLNDEHLHIILRVSTSLQDDIENLTNKLQAPKSH
ncbi:hypothetical protein QTP88_007465 [Uroleucon formosanum]